MTVRFRAKQQTYLLREEAKTFTVWHPQVKFQNKWCYLQDESTRTRLVESPDVETATEQAIEALRKLDRGEDTYGTSK